MKTQRELQFSLAHVQQILGKLELSENLLGIISRLSRCYSAKRGKPWAIGPGPTSRARCYVHSVGAPFKGHLLRSLHVLDLEVQNSTTSNEEVGQN